MKYDFIQKNRYTRPGTLLKEVRKIVLHWTANPGGTAENHQKYFNGTAIKLKHTASAHIFIDETEAVCIIPLNEVAYHANDIYERNKEGKAYRGVPEISLNANKYSISVEMCVEKNGTISPITISRSAEVIAELCKTYKLTENDIVRHYDVTHKPCPKPFVIDPELFERFKKSVANLLEPEKEYPGTVLKLGSKGEYVKEIQKALNVPVDGIFGPKTHSAVLVFQKRNNLTTDGLIGKNTWNKLFN